MFDLLSRERGRIRTAEPGADLRGQAAGSKPLEKAAHAVGRIDDHGKNFPDERAGVAAKSVPTGQVVDKRVEHRHIFLPRGRLQPQAAARFLSHERLRPSVVQQRDRLGIGDFAALDHIERLRERNLDDLDMLVVVDSAAAP